MAFSSDNNSAYDLPLKCIVVDRPKELAQDDTPHGPVILHALLEVERRLDETYDYVMLLQPTNPGRTIDEVERAISMCEDLAFQPVDFLYCYYVDENLNYSYIVSNMDPSQSVTVKSGCVYMYSRQYIMSGFDLQNGFIAMKVSKTRGYNINVPQDIAIQEALWKSENL